MVGTIKQVEREIVALEQAVIAIAKEFHNTYTGYLTALGKAVRQQLILASYHVCTQGYPEKFLHLSFNQRQQLQQSLREVTQQVQVLLLEQLRFLEEEVPQQVDSDKDADTPATTLQAIPSNNSGEGALEATEFSLFEEADEEVDNTDTEVEVSNPLRLMRWQKNVEHMIVEVLRDASRRTNRILQQADILPKKLPEPVLEAAAKSEAASEAVSGPPNLLNLLVETVGEDVLEGDEDEASRHSSVAHIVAIHLRLAEIEFTDSTVSAWRTKIRSLISQLQTLRREYQKKQRERAIAEAEAAWRSAWFED